MAVELVYSDSLVEQRRALTLDLLDTLPEDEPAAVLSVSMLPRGENAGIDSYLRQLRRYVERPFGLNGHNITYYGGRYNTVAGAAGALLRHAGRPGASIVMTPTRDGQLPALLDALAQDPSRDGDSMTAAGRLQHMSATPVAEWDLLESVVGPIEELDPERIAFVGAGMVNGQFIEELRGKGMEPGTIVTASNSAELIPTLHARADVVISATGVAGLLTPQALFRTKADGKGRPPLVVIDAGVGVNKSTGIAHGDADPLLYEYDGPLHIKISGAPVIYPDGTVLHRGRGVGRLTVATFVLQGLVSSMNSPVAAMTPQS